MEAKGLVINASEHYREAAIFSSNNYRAFKLLGSTLFGAGEYELAEKALQKVVLLKHC